MEITDHGHEQHHQLIFRQINPETLGYKGFEMLGKKCLHGLMCFEV